MKTNCTLFKYAFIILILSTSIVSLAQTWPKIYGDNVNAYGRDIIESYDKGYTICGSILKDASHFKFGWLIKTDINGNELWNKKFGTWTVENSFHDFDKTNDDSFILSGSTAKYDIEIDPLFVKLDQCMEIEWCKIFLSPGFNTATGVISLPNSEFLGMLQYYGGQHPSAPRISLVKMDSEGDPIWIKHLAQEDSTIMNEEGKFLYITPDSNYLVAGSCFSPSLQPFYIKTNDEGEEIWDIKWPVGHQGTAYRTVFKANETAYSATNLRFSGHPNKPYLLKFSNNGEIITQFPLLGDTLTSGGASGLYLDQDTALYVGVTWTDDPYLYTGYSDLLKTDTNGNLKVQRRLVDAPYAPNTIIKSSDNKILTLGTFYLDGNWDIYLWKMNTDLEDDTLYTQPLTYDSLCPYEIQSDTVELDCGLFVNINEIPTKEEYESTIKISPSPARDWIVLTFPDISLSKETDIVIYNIFGQEVMKSSVVPRDRTVSLNISTLSVGVYLAACRDAKKRTIKGKFVVER
jgi:hypothetical protein